MSDVGGAMTGGAGPGADGDLDYTGGGADADAGEDKVICTICMKSDGSFTMYQGDEPDEGDEDAGAAAGPTPGAPVDLGSAAPGGAGPTPPDAAGAGGEADESEADQGESFGTVAELMKAVLETVKEAQDSAGGGEDANMQAGYDQEAGGAEAA